MSTAMTPPCLGIDIAKASFVAALRFNETCVIKNAFDNHPGGFRQLKIWLQKHAAGQVSAGLESTSTYAEALAHWLHAEGHRVYLLNPERAACYARACGQRNKTDPADAVMIAAFVATHPCTLWRPPSPEQQTLRSLTRTRHQLVECGKHLGNQLKTAGPAAKPHLQVVLASVRTQLKAIWKEITAYLRKYPQLGDQVRRLRTVNGVGELTAAITVAELPAVDEDTDPRALCAWAGLTPGRRQSGKTELPAHLSRKGNVYLRQALFMPALVAKKHNPVLRAFAQTLAQNGKRPGAIVGAVAHKLLRILVGLFKNKTDFDPNWSLNKSN